MKTISEVAGYIFGQVGDGESVIIGDCWVSRWEPSEVSVKVYDGCYKFTFYFTELEGTYGMDASVYTMHELLEEENCEWAGSESDAIELMEKAGMFEERMEVTQ